MIDLIALLDQKLTFLDSQIKETSHTRDTAATPTESHSDKTRQIAEQLLDKYRQERKALESLKREVTHLPKFNQIATPNSLVTLKTPLGAKEFLLVPEGLGGQTINGVFLLSINSPLAQCFLNRKVGFTFSFNNTSYQILFLNPNSQ